MLCVMKMSVASGVRVAPCYVFARACDACDDVRVVCDVRCGDVRDNDAARCVMMRYIRDVLQRCYSPYVVL
jgi:hypothetical protein